MWIKLGEATGKRHLDGLARQHPGLAREPAAAGVALLREPLRRPPGLHDRPLSSGRPRNRAGSFSEMSSVMVAFYCPTEGTQQAARSGIA